ncbi:hypothetical protein PANT_8c00035 [Moesziomyces antarcticus T-34]|uniref:Uncharacterized protein n=1 Tax=Pseudozyma antarctica (strain T-34) TaxID=1151754 RepID=M9LZZ0_PSEA3|nr:hypothetical protein PANT_8c00035 [Moesziomyces antarcticus T-34]
MAPAVEGKMIDPAPAPTRPRGRPRKVQPEIDPSQPLHPWASTSKPASSRQPLEAQQPRMQRPMPQVVVPAYASQQPAPYAPQQHAAALPVPAYYARPPAVAAQLNYAAMPAPPPAPVQAQPHPLLNAVPLRKRLPTRADLDFLLGGRSGAKARSSTPNPATAMARFTPAPSAAPTVRQASVAPPHHPNDVYTHAQTSLAGSSRVPDHSHGAYAPHPYATVAAPAAPQRPQIHPAAQAAAYTQADDSMTGAPDDDDDGLALGAEAVMESDHNGDSSDADVEDELQPRDFDDPNDADFRPNAAGRRVMTKRRTRVSQAARQSQTSASSVGKVPGSATKRALSSQDSPIQKRRGRPPKEEYTPEMMERIKVANEILATATTTNGKIRLSSIIDKRTRRELSPEMREIGKPESADKDQGASKDRQKRRYVRRNDARADDEADAASGSAIVARAKGKVSEWIKTISSDAEPSGESVTRVEVPPVNGSDASLRGEVRPVSQPADTAQAVQAEDAQAEAEQPKGAQAETTQTGDSAAEPTRPADEQPDDTFARFATVTGHDAAMHAEPADAAEPALDSAAAPAAPATGAPGDEYYFST